MGVMNDPSPSAEWSFQAYRAGTTRMSVEPGRAPNQGGETSKWVRDCPCVPRTRDTQSTAQAATTWGAPEVRSLRNKLLAFAQAGSCSMISLHHSGSERISTNGASVRKQRA
jgi:hypothetical protein